GGDCGSGAAGRGDRAGEEARLEQPALVGVGALEHRNMVEPASRKGGMEVKRQDLRTEIGRDAEAAEDAFVREDLLCTQPLETGKVQGAAAGCIGVFLGESVAEGPVSGERWHVVIHVRAALDDRALEQPPTGEAPEVVRGGELRRDAETAGR